MKKIIASLLAVMMMASAFADCGSSNTTSSTADGDKTSSSTAADSSNFGDEDNITLKVWGPDASIELLKKQCDAFIAQYPDKTIKIDVVAQGEADAASQLQNDATTAADVFGLPSDQLNKLVNAKVIQEVAFADEVKAANNEKVVNAATINGMTLEAIVTDLTAKTGEKVQVGKYFAVEGEFVTNYNHQGNRLATIVAFNKSFEGINEVAHEVALQIAANLSIAFEPFLPFSSAKLRQMLSMTELQWEELGNINLLKEGQELGEVSLLFEKIEDATIQAQLDRLANIKAANEEAEKQEALKNWRPADIKENTNIDEFGKMDIRVATVLDCQPVKKSDRLLQFRLDDGMGGRTILSGIAQSYPDPSVLVGKQVLFIANFPPRKMMGIESQGMILSAVCFPLIALMFYIES